MALFEQDHFSLGYVSTCLQAIVIDTTAYRSIVVIPAIPDYSVASGPVLSIDQIYYELSPMIINPDLDRQLILNTIFDSGLRIEGIGIIARKTSLQDRDAVLFVIRIILSKFGDKDVLVSGTCKRGRTKSGGAGKTIRNRATRGFVEPASTA